MPKTELELDELSENDKSFVKLVLLAHGGIRAKSLANRITVRSRMPTKPTKRSQATRNPSKKPYRTPPDLPPAKTTPKPYQRVKPHNSNVEQD